MGKKEQQIKYWKLILLIGGLLCLVYGGFLIYDFQFTDHFYWHFALTVFTFVVGILCIKEYLALRKRNKVLGGKGVMGKKDMKYAKAHIKCDCGHYAKDHYLTEGCCSAKCPEVDNRICGCTWYHPNVHWIKKQKAETLEVRG